jgi:hypothetical protein
VAAVQGKHLLLECELEGENSSKTAFHLLPAVGKRPESAFGTNAVLLVQPEGALAKDIAASGETFCRAFPNRFFYVDPNRNLAAGFHLVEGFFRDDQPLVEKVLTKEERAELDRLWKELDFVTQRTETLLRGFVWFERAERHVIQDKRFDYLRSDDPLLVEEELLGKFERMYLEKLGVKLVEGELKPLKTGTQFELIHGFFQQVRAWLSTSGPCSGSKKWPSATWNGWPSAPTATLCGRARRRPCARCTSSCGLRARASRSPCAARSARC